MIKKTAFFLSSLCFSVTVFAANVGEKNPGCTVDHFEQHHKININDYHGKVLYLDFWASWCTPCKLSFPTLNKIYKEFNDQGLEIVAINLDENKKEASKFLDNSPVNFTIAHDPEGNCPSQYQVMAMPSSYIVDKQGFIRKIHLGFTKDDAENIRQTILSLLAE